METTLLVIIGFFVGFVLSRYVDLNFKLPFGSSGDVK